MLKTPLKDILQKQKMISYMLVGACIAAFIGFCTYQIGFPGVQYDEITFSNIALGAKTDQFVALRIKGIPLMVMPYIGALKAYLYFPVFALFGASALTIRLPMIILAAFTLVMAYKVAVRLSDSLWVGNAVVLMMSMSLCFIITTKMDWGPTTIMMFLLFLTIWAFFRLLDTHKLVYAYVIFLSIMAGIYDKSSFIWFGGAFGLSALIFHRELFVQLWKEKGKHFRAPFIAFLAIIAAYALIVIPYISSLGVGQSQAPFLERLSGIFGTYKSVLSGSAYTGYMFGTYFDFSFFSAYLSVACFFGLIAFCAFSKLRKELKRNCAMLMATAVIIYLEMGITKEAGGPHHVIMLYPFAMLFIALFGYCAVTAFQGKRLPRLFAGTACALALAVMTGFNLQGDIWYTGYVSDENNSYSSNWDPKIYELSEYIRALGAQNVYSVDWGTHNQLYAFDPQRDEKTYFDLIWFFEPYDQKTPVEKDYMYNEYFEGKEVVCVLKGDGKYNFPLALEGFHKFQEEYPEKSFELIHTIHNAAGEPLYLLYRAA